MKKKKRKLRPWKPSAIVMNWMLAVAKNGSAVTASSVKGDTIAVSPVQKMEIAG